MLSTEAGAWPELMGAADGVSPFDIERHRRPRWRPRSTANRRSDGPGAGALQRDASARTPADWLADQLAAAG